MMTFLTHMAAADAASSGNIFESLGIDWKMLVFQMLGFVVLVWLLGKFVYPILMKTVDERQEAIEAGTKAAEEAQEMAAEAEKKIAATLETARKEARDIVATAKDEATAAVATAETKASDRAKKIVESAREQIDKDVIAAKKSLHNETVELVALATETVLQQKVDSRSDQALVASAVKAAK